MNLLGLGLGVLVALDPAGVERLDLLHHHLGDITGRDFLAGARVDHVAAGGLVNLLDHIAKQGGGLGVHLALVAAHVECLTRLPVHFRQRNLEVERVADEVPTRPQRNPVGWGQMLTGNQILQM